jgi:hypothetical protein
MAYPVCKIKNISGDTLTIHGQEMANNAVYVIQDIDRIDWASDDSVIASITNDDVQVGDADTWLMTHAMQIAHLQGY